MLKTKYLFLKKYYLNSVIVFVKHNGLYVYYDDLYCLKNFKEKKLLANLSQFHINHIIIRDMEIESHFVFSDNRYREYLLKGFLIELLLDSITNSL